MKIVERSEALWRFACGNVFLLLFLVQLFILSSFWSTFTQKSTFIRHFLLFKSKTYWPWRGNAWEWPACSCQTPAWKVCTRGESRPVGGFAILPEDELGAFAPCWRGGGSQTWLRCEQPRQHSSALWLPSTTCIISSTCLPVALNYLKKSPRTAAASSSAARSSPRRTKRPFLTFIPCTIVAPQWIDTVGTMNLPIQFYTSAIIAKSLCRPHNGCKDATMAHSWDWLIKKVVTYS